MKIIKPSVNLIFPNQIENPMKHIERCARVCYKSENSATEDSAKRMIKSLVKSGHFAAIEHYNFIAQMSKKIYKVFDAKDLKYFNVTVGKKLIISGNARSFYEAYTNALDVLKREVVGECIWQIIKKYDCPELFGDKVYNKSKAFDAKIISMDELEGYDFLVHGWFTAHFVCDRGVSHEIVRHRIASYCQESQRYCDYSKDKFRNDVTFILPLFFDAGMGTDSNRDVYTEWKKACQSSEDSYLKLLSFGATPQEARTVLNNSVKTELYMTTTLERWIHFFDLRCDKAAHPQMRQLSIPALDMAWEEYPDVFYYTKNRIKYDK